MSENARIEALLQDALAPVEPPARLQTELETALGSLVDAAAEELEAWEISAMRDPRNWARPAGAVVIGSTAAVALVVVRTRRRGQQRRRKSRNVIDLAGHTLKDLGGEAARVTGDATRRR